MAKYPLGSVLAKIAKDFDSAPVHPRGSLVPTLIVWGTDDIYFDVKLTYWLSENIWGTRRRIEFERARIFFSEERWEAFNSELRNHWLAVQSS